MALDIALFHPAERIPDVHTKQSDEAQPQAEDGPADDFTLEHGEPIAHADVADRQGADDQRRRLRAGVPPA